ncbi:MAG: hypothetical protein JWL76_262 [Thermoleophilia bacterium]|nr:hypothetical protein [Thermoleophilia bacterium]
MSDARDAHDQLGQPLHPDPPFHGEWPLTLEVQLERPATVERALDAIRSAMTDGPNVEELWEVEWTGPDERGFDLGSPCSHVPVPGPYRRVPPLTDGRIVLAPGVELRPIAGLEGCELCATRLHVTIPEDQVRAAWHALRGRTDGDDELRPWRSLPLAEPHLQRVVEHLSRDADVTAELRWGDRRGASATFHSGSWQPRRT